MTTQIYILYVATVFLMMSTPGPSHLLMLSNAMQHGFRRSLATAAGDLSANILQMLAAGLGLVVILVTSKDFFTIIKWAGVGYLIYMGLRQIWRARQSAIFAGEQQQTSLKKLWFQGFLTSAANPKAVVFFAALFPQFISPNADFWSQFLILSTTYIMIDGVFLSLYGGVSGWLAVRFKGQGRLWIERIGGVALIGAALMLGLKTPHELHLTK